MSRADECTIDGCSKLQDSRGMCRMHYVRVQRHGSPHIRLSNGKPTTVPQLMEKYVPHRPENECWVWQGGLDKSGYGVTNAMRPTGRRGPSRAHRVIYEALVGPIPAGKLLMHSCDNPPCVNPAHLRPGTDAENLADMAAKGRSARGSKHRAAKLDEPTVMEIRRKYATGKYQQRDLAIKYGLTPTPMSQLLRGITWKHLPLVERDAA